MKPEICALNLVTLDFIYSGIHRLPGLGEEVSTDVYKRQALETATNGRLQVELYEPGALCQTSDILTYLSQNAFDLSLIHISKNVPWRSPSAPRLSCCLGLFFRFQIAAVRTFSIVLAASFCAAVVTWA